MSGVYNVSKIILNGQTINGVDVSTLGVSTQKVPSSFVVKNEINKIKKLLVDTVEELEIYKVPTLTSTFVDVPGYPGVKIGLALKMNGTKPADNSVIADYADVSTLNNLVAEKAITYTRTSINHDTKIYNATKPEKDVETLEGWIVKLSPKEMNTSAYKIPRKIFYNDQDTSSNMKIIKIIMDDESNSGENKRLLTSIYAPDVVVFGTNDPLMKMKDHAGSEEVTDEWLYEIIQGSNPPATHISTDWTEHTRIDVTTRAFVGEFYPPMNQDIVLHNQEVIDLKYVIAIEKEITPGTPPTVTVKYGLIPNLNLTDNYNTCVYNLQGYSATVTVPLCDYSIGLDGNTFKGFSDTFIEKTRLEIPKDCKLSYKLETLHSHKYMSDSTGVLYYVIRTDCFESDYLSATFVGDHEIQIPVKRYRMISEDEYFVTEYFGLKNSLMFDMLEQKEHESFDQLGHLHLKHNTLPSSFEYETIKYFKRFRI